MGLIEKRAIANIRDNVVPRYETELQQIAGDQVSYEIIWESSCMTSRRWRISKKNVFASLMTSSKKSP